MPLEQGHSRETISANIGELIKAGHKPNQAAAIAYKTAGLAKDMSDEDWDELLGGLGKFFAEEREEPEHQVDDVLPEHTREEIGTVGSEHREELSDTDFLEPKEKKYPVKLNGKYDRNLLLAAAREARMHGHEELAKKADAIRAKEFANDRLALDFDSVRRYDDDGRLHVEQANISKACVNPYYGREIPGADTLGLDANKIYHLLRDPEELKKAVDKLNGVPLQREHKPTSADDHQTMDTVGAVGTNAVYEHPYLKNALVIWPQESIDGVENNSKRQLSMGYKYRADMTPGTYEGEQYDGVMRDIVPNHVALVENGRAGPDVVVGDSALGSTTTSQEISMGKHVLTRKAAVAQGAVLAQLKPLLAADAKLDLGAAFAPLTAKNYKAQRIVIVDALKPSLKLKTGVAMDAALKAINLALDEVEPEEVEEGMDLDPNSGLPMTKMPEAKDDGDMSKVMAYLKEHAPEHHAAVTKMMGGEDEEMKRKEGEDDATFLKRAMEVHDARRARDEKPEEKKEVVTPAAMDAAIKVAVDVAEQKAKAATEARAFVEPWVGKVSMAHDSAESIHRAALDMLHVTHKDIHPSALQAVIAVQPKLNDRAKAPILAGDASTAKKFDEMFPGAERIVAAA